LAVLNQGQVLFRGSPRDLIAAAEGKVWTVIIPRSGTQAAQDERPDSGLSVVSTLQLQDGVQYRVLGVPSEQYDAQPAAPSLEDGYIWLMRQAKVVESG